MLSRFRWITFDVTDLLPPDWQRDVLTVAASADFREFPRTPILTREAEEVKFISRGRVHANQVRRDLPWLQTLYLGTFLDLAQQAWHEPVVTAHDSRYGLVLNVQRGTDMRFECHIDSNPLTGLLFLTSHEAGGEIAIARDLSASDMEAIDRNCSVIPPHAGHLIFFDARQHPHYVRRLTSDSDTRVIAAMNFYTESFPESTRPRLLNKHLYGDPDLSGHGQRRQAALPASARAAVAVIVALPRTVSSA
jgi:hypothetical protein